jgi:hypothetical protein
MNRMFLLISNTKSYRCIFSKQNVNNLGSFRTQFTLGICAHTDSRIQSASSPTLNTGCNVMGRTKITVYYHAGGPTSDRAPTRNTLTKNADFWDIKTQFVLHRRHITSPLQSSASYCYVRLKFSRQ